jgi:NADPH:quinone reductase-like Zn-dependent oxidoreductase
MRTVRFHDYGEPADVLHLENTPVPDPDSGQIRVAVLACGLAPADWALCGGLFPGTLPRGIGCDVAGTVTAVGDGVTGTTVGDLVFGTTDWANRTSAGAADEAVMDRWFPVPDGLDPVEAAAMPMTVDTAAAHLHWLGADAAAAAGTDEAAARTILIHGAGSTIGFAAVQMALNHGLTVIATAGDTYADQLRSFGAQVTDYGDDMVAHVAALAGGPVELVLDAAPVGGRLPELIATAGGDPSHVMTVSDHEAAERLGARSTFREDLTDRVEALPDHARLAVDGRFRTPVARTFPLEQWREALELSQGGHARGKLMLIP